MKIKIIVSFIAKAVIFVCGFIKATKDSNGKTRISFDISGLFERVISACVKPFL